MHISHRHTKPYSCRAILYIFSRSCIASRSTPDESHILTSRSFRQHLWVARMHDRLRYAWLSSPANAARFCAMPSVTIVAELSHTLDLMDSRRLLRPRPWSLLEISSSSYPSVTTSSALPSRIISVHCLAAYNGEDFAVLRKWRKKRELL